MNASALALTDVHVTFAGRRRSAGISALSGVTLNVDMGERVAIVGRSGAGKSTIARLACGLVRPTGGSVSALGMDLAQLSTSKLRALRQRMHLVFQDPYQSLHPGLRIREIVGEPLSIGGMAAKDQALHVSRTLTRVGLSPPNQFLERRPNELSGGQRQRVAIARAVVTGPKLILADEPTSMLDASLRASIADMLIGLQQSNSSALVFVTHDLALARHVADRIVVLSEGEVAEDRPTEELLKDPHHPETVKLLTAARHHHRHPHHQNQRETLHE